LIGNLFIVQFQATQNTRFINQLKHCKYYVHTGMLESYHNLCLVYSPKRIVYSYTGMVLRTILAILDHNNNVGRKVKSQVRKYSKATKQWKLRDVYETKKDQWRLDLVQKIVSSATNKEMCEVSPAIQKILFPFELPKNIAPIEKPTMAELIAKDQYRAK
jgi:diphthamide synthase subunit DPH2